MKTLEEQIKFIPDLIHALGSEKIRLILDTRKEAFLENTPKTIEMPFCLFLGAPLILKITFDPKEL